LKIALIRGKTNQKNECQTGKKKTTKNLIEWWNWKPKKIYKMNKNKIRNWKNED